MNQFKKITKPCDKFKKSEQNLEKAENTIAD